MHATKTFRRRSATICRGTRRKYSAMPSTMPGRPTVNRRALKKSHIGSLGRRSKSAIRNWVRSGCHAKRHCCLVETTSPLHTPPDPRCRTISRPRPRSRGHEPRLWAQGYGLKVTGGTSPAATSADPTALNALRPFRQMVPMPAPRCPMARCAGEALTAENCCPLWRMGGFAGVGRTDAGDHGRPPARARLAKVSDRARTCGSSRVELQASGRQRHLPQSQPWTRLSTRQEEVCWCGRRS